MNENHGRYVWLTNHEWQSVLINEEMERWLDGRAPV